MNFYFKQLNADAQENAGAAEPVEEASAATTTAPVETAEAVATPAEEPAKPQVPAIDETAHDDFDWSVDKRNVSSYSKEEKEKYDKVYDNTFIQLNDGELVNGTVVGLTNTDVVLNIGFKAMAYFSE